MQNTSTVTVPAGTIAYRESGDPSLPVALYVHGVIVNSYLWRHQLDAFADVRHNIAIDLLGHGHSTPADGQGLTFTDQTEMFVQFLDAMGIETVDLVASDSGTGIAQIFAVNHPERARSLVVTNGDVHDNWPPAAFQGFTDRVAAGELPSTTVLADRLAQLRIPTLIIWGTGDIFFDLTGARWLASTMPEAREPVVLEGGALLLPSERAGAVSQAILQFWLETERGVKAE